MEELSARKAQFGRPIGRTRQEHEVAVAAVGEAALGGKSRWQGGAQALVELPDASRLLYQRDEAGQILERFTKGGVAGHRDPSQRTGEGELGYGS